MNNCIHDVEHWMLNGLTSVPTLWLEYKDLMNLRFGMFLRSSLRFDAFARHPSTIPLCG